MVRIPFGFKAHLAVGTNSQYILQSMMSSSSLNNGKAAIPLLKGIQEKLSPLTIRYGFMDAGYDFVPIYQQLLSMKESLPIISAIKEKYSDSMRILRQLA